MTVEILSVEDEDEEEIDPVDLIGDLFGAKRGIGGSCIPQLVQELLSLSPEELAKPANLKKLAEVRRKYAEAGTRAKPIRNEEVATGRNAPCPCGSGHKFKKCCIKKRVEKKDS